MTIPDDLFVSEKVSQIINRMSNGKVDYEEVIFVRLMYEFLPNWRD
jgi:hypothetical protein